MEGAAIRASNDGVHQTRNGRRWSGLSCLVLLVGSGCGAAAESSEVELDFTSGQIMDPELAPEEVVHRGKAYVRADLYVESDFERSLLDAPEDGPLARDKLARQLRAHMLKGGVYYIEAHLDYELADKVLSGEVPLPTDPAPALEGRTIFENDDRIPLDFQGNVPFASKALAFSSRGVGGALIGPTTALTCGHCMYQTGDTENVPNGWKCGDDSVSSNCAGPGYPDWRFGVVTGTDGVTEWISCNYVPNSCYFNAYSSVFCFEGQWEPGGSGLPDCSF